MKSTTTYTEKTKSNSLLFEYPLYQKSKEIMTKTTKRVAHWIYRYKDGGICVAPSRSKSEEDCWDFAIHALRPAWMKDDDEANRYMHEIGEVIKDDE